jgi:hypothetical protein
LKKQLFSLLVCLFLFVSFFSVLVINVKAPAGDGIVEVDVPPRGTFLHAIDGYPYHGGGTKSYDPDLDLDVIVGPQYNVEDPAIVDLNAEGFVEGDKIIISYTADLYYAGTYNPTYPNSTGWPLRIEENLLWGGLLGVFSTSSVVLDIDADNRIPGAIPSGISSIETPTTKWREDLQSISDKLQSKNINWYTGPMDTDIPEDFLIKPYTGMDLVIPRNARFLFLCCIDDIYYDNLGEIKVTIEKDSDGDGLPDSWEQNGIDIDGDGTVDLDLPMLGADWEHKDIFVEIDYFGTTTHNSHRPDFSAIDAVKNAFANAPVSNPDGVTGINLHVIIDDVIYVGGTNHQDFITWGDFDNIKKTYFGTLDERKYTPKAVEAKKLVFHYCIFGHDQTESPGSSGSGERPGNDFMVTLGTFTNQVGSRDEQAGTFMHELGHNLGLFHGGNNDVNYKPNYLSVMSYSFQFSDLYPTRNLDYSRNTLIDLDETKLDEISGIGAWKKTVWRGPDSQLYNTTGTPAIDWNVDGNYGGSVQVNLNDHPGWGYNSLSNEILTGYDDWKNIIYRFRASPNFADGVHQNVADDELTSETADAMRQEVSEIKQIEGQPLPHVTFGVKEGDWMEWLISYVGNPPEDFAHIIRIEVIDVQEDEITLSWERELLNGEFISNTETYATADGVHDLFIIGANLEVGDMFYHEQFGGVFIGGTEDYAYAGEERTVIWSMFSEGNFHWDKTTGVLTQYDGNYSPTLEAKWLLTKTSLWGSGTGLDLTLIAGLVVAVAAILMIVLLFIRRKKKNEQEIPT